MKPISFDEWQRRFEMLDGDQERDINDEHDSLVFFDNGAVRNEAGDFVVKTDQVKESA